GGVGGGRAHPVILPDRGPEAVEVGDRPAPQRVVVGGVDAAVLADPARERGEVGAFAARLVGAPQDRRLWLVCHGCDLFVDAGSTGCGHSAPPGEECSAPHLTRRGAETVWGKRPQTEPVAGVRPQPGARSPPRGRGGAGPPRRGRGGPPAPRSCRRDGRR